MKANCQRVLSDTHSEMEKDTQTQTQCIRGTPTYAERGIIMLWTSSPAGSLWIARCSWLQVYSILQGLTLSALLLSIWSGYAVMRRLSRYRINSANLSMTRSTRLHRQQAGEKVCRTADAAIFLLASLVAFLLLAFY